MKCPLCESEMNHHQGSTDDGGVRSWPSVSCGCGFYFSPKTDHVQGSIGLSGWSHTDLRMKEGNRIIKEKFATRSTTDVRKMGVR